jgi:hypothetical protein
MDEATWLASTHFQKLYGYLKSGQGTALTKEGRRKLRLLACVCCRLLLWHMPVRDCDRKAVEAAEAFADGLIDGQALGSAHRACHARQGGGARACWAMASTTDKTAAAAAYVVPLYALAALGPEDDLANRKRLCDLVRDIFGNPFRPFAIDSVWRRPDVLRLWRPTKSARCPRATSTTPTWPFWPTPSKRSAPPARCSNTCARPVPTFAGATLSTSSYQRPLKREPVSGMTRCLESA